MPRQPLLLGALSVAAWFACSGNEPSLATVTPAACVGTYGCDGGWVCISPSTPESPVTGVCAQPCASADGGPAGPDCPSGMSCGLFSTACYCCNCACAVTYACTPTVQPEWHPCGPDAGCAADLVCADGTCRMPCGQQDAGFCQFWELCGTHACVQETLDGGGTLALCQ